MSRYYDPSRMVIAAVNVNHEEIVELARKYFVNPRTTWSQDSEALPDKSVAQFTGGVITVCIVFILLLVHWLYRACLSLMSYLPPVVTLDQ